jgi:hypothetical protein
VARSRSRWSWIPLAVAAVASACAAPVAADRRSVLTELATRYAAFFPDGGGLVHPRFGDPDIARRGDVIAIELLRRDDQPAPRVALVAAGMADADAHACAVGGVAAPGCWPVALAEVSREHVDARTSDVRFAARTDAPVGGYDLVVDDPAPPFGGAAGREQVPAVDDPAPPFGGAAGREQVPAVRGMRAARAVWLRDDDPSAPRPLHVVQLSDLHVGKHAGSAEAHLAEVIRDVNALHPDLVIVTGDVVDQGEDGTLAPRAAAILRGIDAPLFTVVGNHDLGRSLSARTTRRYGVGWEHDAHAFHPLLSVSLVLGDWEFVGFDTGPGAGVGTRVNVRGVGPDTIAQLGAVLAEARRVGRRGVVLASHAPTRASLFGGTSHGRGVVGRMARGGDAVEAMLLAAAANGQRVIHLAGHTHWSDVFEAEAGRDGPRFARWAALSACPRSVRGNAALVTTQSASIAGLFAKSSARGYGYAELWLDETVRVAHHRYGSALDRRVCER